MHFASVQDGTVALEWLFGGIAVAGAYCLVVAPVLYMHHLHRRPKTPKPNTPSPYDLAAMRKESTRRRYSLQSHPFNK
jgi:hypothetical protein